MKAIKTLAAAAALLAGTAAQAELVSIATLPQGSVFNTMGNVVAAEARKSTDLKPVVQPYGSNLSMLEALQQQLAEFTFLDVNDVATAVAGTNDYEGHQLDGLRVVARINPFPIGLFVKDGSELKTVADLKGHTVPSG